MIRWNNDYNHGAHPSILEALQKTNDMAYGGYGIDEWCEKASEEIKKYLKNDDAEVHFMVGGTPVNYTVITAALRPFQSVLSADSGHINVHETGAVENTGHKVQALPEVNGKLTAKAVAAEAEAFRSSDIPEHVTMPKMVYISSPTEYGTVYSKAELEALRAVCNEYDLYLYLDGARMGYGLAAEDCDWTLEDLARICDAFYIGGTKCGTLFGEAVILINDDLKYHFRSYIKQNGNMLAKGWLLGLQFYTLFKDGLYFEITQNACRQAMRIKKAFEKKGIPSFYENCTNQQFVIMTQEQMKIIAEKHIFEVFFKREDGRSVVRFCTSWSTVDADVDCLISDIDAL